MFDSFQNQRHLLKEYPCKILLRHVHNHAIKAADAVPYRTPTQSVQIIFQNLFDRDHSPSSALEIQHTGKESRKLSPNCGR